MSSGLSQGSPSQAADVQQADLQDLQPTSAFYGPLSATRVTGQLFDKVIIDAQPMQAFSDSASDVKSARQAKMASDTFQKNIGLKDSDVAGLERLVEKESLKLDENIDS